MRFRSKSRVKRVDDKLRIKEIFWFFASVSALTMAWGFIAWQRLQIVRLKNEISNALRIVRNYEDNNRKLKLKRASLRSLPRVVQRAKKELGMVVLEKDRLIILDESWQKQP